MAFNPFTAFRKHQKVFFAALTILCMITFILMFGQADPFSYVLRLLSQSRAGGEEVTKLYGKSIREGDLQQVYRQRLLAAGFMTASANPNLVAFMQEVAKEKVRQDPTPVQQLAHRFVNVRPMAAMRMTPEVLHRDVVSDLRTAILASEAPGLEKDAEAKARLDAAAEALAFQAWATSIPRNAGSEAMFYFGGSSRTSDLLDFLIWKHQADQLGIVLSFEDLCKEINRRCAKEVYTADTFATSPNVETYLRYNKARSGATTDELIKALTDEFRVVMAKEALLGLSSADGVPGWRSMFTLVRLSPAAVTPDEFLDYYRQQRTIAAVTMLPLSVESFRQKVTDRPSEGTLRNLYEAYQDREPVPDQRVPGFKEPRRIRLAWFSYTPRAEFYKKKAARLGGLPPLLRIGAGANNYAAGGGPAVWAVQAATLALDNRHFVAYGAYQEEEHKNFAKDIGVSFDIKDRRPLLQRPELAAGLAGQLAGASGVGGAASLMGPLYLRNTAALYEVKTVQHFGSAMLAGATHSLGPVTTLPLTYTHTTMPMESVLPRLQEQFEEGLAREIAIQDVTELGKEMARIKNPADHPAEVERVLREAAAKYGLEDVHVMTEPRTAFELREDPGPDLEKLKKAYDDCLEKEQREFIRQFQPMMPAFPDFVGAVLEGKGVNPPYWSEELARTGRNIPPGRKEDRRLSISSADFQVFHEKEKDRDADPGMSRTWMFWRIEDKPTRSHSFEEVRGEVLQAWKTEQARVLARREADRIVNELKQRKWSPADAVRFLREKKDALRIVSELIELNRVARQVPLNDFVPPPGAPAGSRRFKPYKLPSKTIAYPAPDMLDRILAMQEDGDATVVTDRPQMHFYVTVLMDRKVPTVREFAEIYREPVGGRIGDESTMWQQLIDDRREEVRQKLLEQLRADAGKVDDQGNLVISEKARERQDRSTEGGD